MFVDIGNIQTWRAFPNGDFKMEKLHNSHTFEIRTEFFCLLKMEWPSFGDASHFGMRVTKKFTLFIVTQLMSEWHNISSKNEK